MMNEEDKNQEINRKRKHNNNNQDFPFVKRFQEPDLTLRLNFGRTRPRQTSPVNQSLPSTSSPPPPPPSSPPSPSTMAPSQSMQALFSQTPSQIPPQLFSSHSLYNYMPPFVPPPQQETSTSIPVVYHRPETATPRPSRARRNPTQVPRAGKSETVPALFPWATTHRATVHSLAYMLSNEIVSITGEVQCKRCEIKYEMEYDLKEKFRDVARFIENNKSNMRDRAPSIWMNPVLPRCKYCEHENSVKPIIADKKKGINWLFLLLGQMIGCCTLEQLKYFCKHTKNHRTGAKDRVLYLTYLGLCKQLCPDGPFDR